MHIEDLAHLSGRKPQFKHNKTYSIQLFWDYE